jgi:hypothetical protein
MDKRIYYLRDESHLIETCYNVITWLDRIGSDCIASPDLIVLIEQFYFEN